MAGAEGGEVKDPASAHYVGVVEEDVIPDATNGRSIITREQKIELLKESMLSVHIPTTFSSKSAQHDEDQTQECESGNASTRCSTTMSAVCSFAPSLHEVPAVKLQNPQGAMLLEEYLSKALLDDRGDAETLSTSSFYSLSGGHLRRQCSVDSSIRSCTSSQDMLADQAGMWD
eukprot:TRINITY_DN9891_c0_g1_i1.p1 TRINITY_DN9891_c0_g1~~TRINITY_DN9891_c0_g1_i1.p1  ORF type:complete len:193 (+),score=41.32 TRINITY_DN9891_c0_g1_i1:63-581(+)